ncbi:MAG: MFS transporter [Gammaproteobacteria bacterium]|nr:MAG: MFS transporter [Gammaproteobacteria bacterium]
MNGLFDRVRPDDASAWRAWCTTILLALTATLAYIDRTLLNLLVEPIKADLSLSDTQVGVLQGVAFSLFYGTLSVPIGRLADATSRKRVIMTAMLAWSAVTAATGFATSYLTMFLCRAGVAAGEAGVSPASGSMIADLFPRARLALPMSVYTMSIYVGSGLALFLGGWMIGQFEGQPTVAVPLLGEMVPWRASFVIVGLLGIPWFLLIGVALREPRRTEHTTYQLQRNAEGSLSIREVAGFLLRYRSFFAGHFLGFTLALAMISGMLAWMPTILIRVFSMPIEEVGRAFGLAYILCGLAGAFLGGWCSNRLSARGRRQAPLELAMLAPLGALACTAGLLLVDDPTLALALCGGTVFFIAPTISLSAAAYLLVTPNRVRAQVSGLFLMVTGVLGIGTGPIIVAMITDGVFADEGMLHYSLAAAGVVLCACMLPILAYARKAMMALDLW